MRVEEESAKEISLFRQILSAPPYLSSAPSY